MGTCGTKKNALLNQFKKRKSSSARKRTGSVSINAKFTKKSRGSSVNFGLSLREPSPGVVLTVVSTAVRTKSKSKRRSKLRSNSTSTSTLAKRLATGQGKHQKKSRAGLGSRANNALFKRFLQADRETPNWLQKPEFRMVRMAPVLEPMKTAEESVSLRSAPSTAAPPETTLAEKDFSSVPAMIEVTPVVPITAAELMPPAPRQEERRDWLPSNLLIRPNESVRSAMDGFLLDLRSEHTRRSYGRDLKRFLKFLIVRKNHFGPEPINRLVIVAYKESLIGEDLQPTTVDRHLSTLRSFFGWMVGEGICDRNPASQVRLLAPKHFSRTNGFTDEEVVNLLAKPNLHTRSGAQHYTILMLLFYCGLRRSELCELRTEQLGFERGHRTLRFTGKGDRERIVVLTPEVWNALKYFFLITGRDPRVSGYLFKPTKNNRTKVMNKPIDSSMIFYIVRKYAKECGITKKVSPHSCRATAISNARDHQVPDRAIQEFAGWSTPNMIVHYDKRRTAIDESAAHSIQYSEGESRKVLPKWAVEEEDWDVFLGRDSARKPESPPEQERS